MAAPERHHPTPSAGGIRIRERKRLSGSYFERYGTLAFFILYFIFIAVVDSTRFASWSNISLILGQNAYLAFLAASATLILLCGQFDLSIGATAGLAAIMTAYLTSDVGLSVPLTILVVLSVGFITALINAFLVIVAKINAFIATLGTGGAIGGVALWVSGGQILYGGIPPVLTNSANHRLLAIPLSFIYAIVLMVLVWALTTRTVVGRYWYAIGSNSEATRLAGVRVSVMTMWAFVGCGLLAAMCGILYTATFASADPNSGPNFLLPAFAAAFLGSAILSDGRFTMLGSVLGTFLIALATNGLEIAGVNFAAQPIFNGAVLVVAVGLTEVLRRRRRRQGTTAPDSMNRRISDSESRHVDDGGDPLHH
jgi:ribose transport system permease protein